MVMLLTKARTEIERGAESDLAVLQALGACGEGKGLGTIAVAAALYLCSRHPEDPARAVVGAAFAARSDTDTVAAMTGGLAGALVGSDGLPQEWLAVQDAAYLRQMARQLSAGADTATVATRRAPRAIRTRDLDGILESIGRGPGGEIDLDGLRTVRVVRARPVVDRSRSMETRSWELAASDGQTLYVTKQRRRKP
jgi:hypothetical protein